MESDNEYEITLVDPPSFDDSQKNFDKLQLSRQAINKAKQYGQASQYANHSGGYKPCSSTVDVLPPGCYDFQIDQTGIFVVPALPPTGLLLELPEMRSDEVIKIVDKFWDSEKDYKEGNEFVHGGAQFKAGVMLYGPPGTGKSCTIKLLAKKLVERGGTVFFASLPGASINLFLNDFARVEPNRKCIVILEDLDALIYNFGESGYLEMLDSAKTIDNVLFIATTNYPDKLDPRIYNRPGRFSHMVHIDYPSPATRAAYLKAILKNHRDVETIVKHSDKFTIDHLSAIVNAVYREGKELLPEIERLRKMYKMPKAGDVQPKIGL